MAKNPAKRARPAAKAKPKSSAKKVSSEKVSSEKVSAEKVSAKKSKTSWRHGVERLLFLIGFGIVAYVSLWLLVFTAIIAYILSLFSYNVKQSELDNFSSRLATYLRQCALYMVRGGKSKPFPFSSFPE